MAGAASRDSVNPWDELHPDGSRIYVDGGTGNFDSPYWNWVAGIRSNPVLGRMPTMEIKMLKSLNAALNKLSGPIGGMLEKACLAAVMYASGKGWIPGDQVAAVAAALYMLVSTTLTTLTNTESAKIQAINGNPDNGVKVVREAAAAPLVDTPMPSTAPAKS